MTIPTNPCDEFEIAALQRTRGALDPDATTRLGAHLASCAACRGFAATAVATEAALRGRVRDAADGRDWERVRAAFRARRRSERNRMFRGLAAFVLQSAICWFALGAVAGTFIAVLIVAVVTFVYLQFVLPEWRLARRAESIDTEMLAFYRADLDKELKGLRGSRQLILVLIMLYVFAFLFMAVDVAKSMWLGHGFPNVGKYVATFVVFTLVGAVLWYRGRRLLPRLERERLELGE